ncbi:MAG: flagellar protein FlaG [Thermodesulfobacteria bacterium]|nr:flagellar protein FlaG [Thermodesulfobacteriota bacterium]
MEVKKVKILNTNDIAVLNGLNYVKKSGNNASEVSRASPGNNSNANPVDQDTKFLKAQLDKLRKSKKVPNELNKLIEKLNKKLDPFDKILKVEIDKDLHIPVFKIIDKDTHQVIRQVPWEEVLKFLKSLFKFLQEEQLKHEDLKGLLFKKEV